MLHYFRSPRALPFAWHSVMKVYPLDAPMIPMIPFPWIEYLTSKAPMSCCYLLYTELLSAPFDQLVTWITFRAAKALHLRFLFRE